MAMVRARAWCRVDLAGGTLDIWPLGLLHRGARTVNLAVDLPVEVTLRLRPRGYRVEQEGRVTEAASAGALVAQPEGALVGVVAEELGLPPLEARLASASPRGGGLGASSAMTVALLAAGERLLGRPPSPPAAVAGLARDLEARLMSLPTGTQDHWPALLGGCLEIEHRAGGEAVRALEVDLEALGSCLLVVYSGRSHFSAANNWQVIRRRLDGDAATVELLAGITAVATEMAAALAAGDLCAAGGLLEREWSYRRRLAPEVSTPLVESLLAAGRAGGAWGGKACGAGGGGCLVLLCAAERKAEVAALLAAAGGQPLPARPAPGPLQIEDG